MLSPSSRLAGIWKGIVCDAPKLFKSVTHTKVHRQESGVEQQDRWLVRGFALPDEYAKKGARLDASSSGDVPVYDQQARSWHAIVNVAVLVLSQWPPIRELYGPLERTRRTAKPIKGITDRVSQAFLCLDRRALGSRRL